MSSADRPSSQPGTKKRSIDDIIDHMTADLQSYEGQYILLGSPPYSQHVWSQYSAQAGQQVPMQNPIFVQQSYDIQERKMQDFTSQHGLFYPNPPRVRDGSGEMIGMVDVGGGNYVNVVFNPTNTSNNIHHYIPSQMHHADTNVNYTHYSQSQPQQQQINGNQPSSHHNYGLFNNDNCGQRNRQLIENLVGNWAPNQSGTYSPFGSVVQNQSNMKEDIGNINTSQQPVQGRKQRIVAEVRPMRPTYSDVLAKSAPPFSSTQSSAKASPANGGGNTTPKMEGKKQISKGGKVGGGNGSNTKNVNTSCLKRQHSSGSEEHGKSGVGGVRRWISLDDLTPPPSCEEQSYIEYDTYNEENVPNNSEYYMHSANNNNSNSNEAKKEKKQKKKSVKQPANEEKFEALNNHKVSGNCRTGNKRPLHINNNLQGKDTAEKNSTKNTVKNMRVTQDETKKGVNTSFNGSGNKTNLNSSEDKGINVSRVSRGVGNSSTLGGKRGQRSSKKKDGQACFGIICKRWQEHMSHYALVFLTWFIHLLWDVLAMSARLLIHMCAVTWETSLVWLMWLRCRICGIVSWSTGERWWNFWSRQGSQPTKPPEPVLHGGLTSNISLPATGDEAMKRLLACKGKDPYSILGVTSNCTDDDIKKYYKRQAVLVHPDKNSQPGAEEAFKILVHAFELIGEPERRSAYDRCVAETHQVEQAWSELSKLLSQLHHKMEYAANTIRCTNCGKRHKRVAMQRPCYAARFCAQCKIHHAAREGDIWAESWMLGFLWHYFACMEGAVYDITEWAACQADNLKHLKANSHAVQYRIVLGKQSTHYRNKDNLNEPDLEEFLNNLYSQSGANMGTSGGSDSNAARQRRKGKRKK